MAFSLDSSIRLWDYVAGSVKKTYQGHKNDEFAVGGCFGLLDSGSFIASASEDGGVILWDVTTKAVLQQVGGHSGVCFWVDINGETMVSGGQDNTIRVYRNATGKDQAVNGDGAAYHEDQDGEHMAEATRSESPIKQEDIKMEDA